MSKVPALETDWSLDVLRLKEGEMRCARGDRQSFIGGLVVKLRFFQAKVHHITCCSYLLVQTERFSRLQKSSLGANSSLSEPKPSSTSGAAKVLPSHFLRI
jgi:hypothetical protein